MLILHAEHKNVLHITKMMETVDPVIYGHSVV